MAKVPAKRWRTRAELLACIEAAKSMLDQAADVKLTLADIGRACGLSPFHLQRYFTKAYGISPHRYLTEIRLRRARDLITSGSASVTEACYEVGFSSPASFSRLFRARFGLAPAEAKPQGKRR
jgi:transcriptional regulator GlxA family with amidase domain